MKLKIDTLTESQLIDLKTRIGHRLRMLHESRAQAAMLEFAIGERVCFQPGRRQMVFGTLTRYNRKTVTVVSDDGEHWNVDPHALRRARGVLPPRTSGNVLPLYRK